MNKSIYNLMGRLFQFLKGKMSVDSRLSEIKQNKNLKIIFDNKDFSQHDEKQNKALIYVFTTGLSLRLNKNSRQQTYLLP